MAKAPEEHKIRAAEETLVGHFLKMDNTIIVLRSCFGWEESAQMIQFRMLKYYIDTFNGVEPYVVVRNGGANKITGYDSMAATRILTLMNSAIIDYNFGIHVPSNVKEEVLRYVLLDPFVNQKKLKGMISLFRLYALSRSKSGYKIRWQYDTMDKPYPEILGYSVQELEKGDIDTIAYKYVEKGIMESSEEMLKADLIGLREFCITLTTEDVTEEALSRVQWLFNVDGITGFGRSETIKSHMAQAASGEKKKVINPTANTYMQDEMEKQLLKNVVDQ